MEIRNNKEEVPFSHYAALFAALDPQEAARRCGVVFSDGCFTLRLMGTAYRIAWPEYAITADREDAFALQNLPCQTFLMRYLLEGKASSESRRYLTFREMPWGEVYIKPFTGRCLTRAAFTFGTRLSKFCAGAEALGGTPGGHGDASYCFSLLGSYRMEIIVWEGDDEFPPNSQILYTDNFADGFSAEDRVVAGDILITAIKENM